MVEESCRTESLIIHGAAPSKICEQKCATLHKRFNALRRFDSGFNKNDMPLNGIYIIFERGEEAHDGDRIVRIGTHTGENQLMSRLWQHFLNENKDRSIFRKNIGRALLNRDKDPFLEQWEIDLTTRRVREANKDYNREKSAEVERRVTKYMQDNMSFAVFEVPKKKDRLRLERGLISTISLCNHQPSKNWLGNFSPIKKIRDSGLWLVQGLYKEPLNDSDFGRLLRLLD